MHRIEDGDAELLRDLGVGRGGFDDLVRVDDRNLQVVLQDPQEAGSSEVLLTDAAADGERQVVDRPAKTARLST
jgi:hypothetical protein